MYDVFEYRVSNRHKLAWLAFGLVIFLLGVATMYNAAAVMWLIWGLAGAALGWSQLRKPAFGIRIDDKFLTLAAWRDPRDIPLSDIVYMQATDWTDDADVRIIRRTGGEDFIYAADLPGVQILSQAMAERGIEVKDPVAPQNVA